ncbi:hypothetical protein EK417_11155 [Chryseobacterium candidae]|uniref:Uncharacterized protein n=2 Tax=Chryseobacterium candidae TaxID=1978493 RepID=A0ABY2R8D6_9FLAO|nr:hypothetical protein EK417_11155 [Chryseobacterium candidae]
MKNNKYIFGFYLLVLVSFFSHAQVLSNGQIQNAFTDSNVFLDASTNYDPDICASNIVGKGLLFPRTDLTKWSFTGKLGDLIFPSAYDGMIVYNTGTGLTPTGNNNTNKSTRVFPGFYYFFNPSASNNINNGVWKPIGENANNAGAPQKVLFTVPVYDVDAYFSSPVDLTQSSKMRVNGTNYDPNAQFAVIRESFAGGCTIRIAPRLFNNWNKRDISLQISVRSLTKSNTFAKDNDIMPPIWRKITQTINPDDINNYDGSFLVYLEDFGNAIQNIELYIEMTVYP